MVADTYALPGEMIGAGAPVVELLPPGQYLGPLLHPGDRARRHPHAVSTWSIGCDNCARELNAKVTFISPQPEYTPPVIYSEQHERSWFTWSRRIPISTQATTLKPGQPVTVRVAP